MTIPQSWLDPPRIFSVMPFWFWNDALNEREIVRQIQDFEAHRVFGFVIHPRVGLPRQLGWMSENLLHFYHVAIEEARRRGMYVILYDEGMYPSGSSSGQVVASNPAFQCRCLAKIDLSARQAPMLNADEHLAAVVQRKNGERLAVIDRKVDSVIRGLHYADESSESKGPAEDEPPAADILNPSAVAEFIHLVYDKFAAHFSPYFGNTIPAIFTDEPGPLGRCRERDVVPGTRDILPEVNRLLGYDFTPHLPALWYDDEPDAQRFRADYDLAIARRLEETYYPQLHTWCQAHGVALTGHPAQGSDIGPLRYFHIPGQDLVWRWVLPDHPSALEGSEATLAKCSSSAMLHCGRQRNSNECCGAYGHQLTWEEMAWLAHWCFIRGVNWLYPHAFYYSIRGPRRDERPPDVGPNSPWWNRFTQYADACRRLSWLNTDGEHVCHIAILGQSNSLPWRSAKVCFEHQRDFNYLEERHLWQDAQVDKEGIHIRGMHYRVLIVEDAPDPRARPALENVEQAERLIHFSGDMTGAELVKRLDDIALQEVRVFPASPGLRVRHVVKDGRHCFMLFNETSPALDIRVELPVSGSALILDPWTGESFGMPSGNRLSLPGHSIYVIVVSGE
jgi:hypothetical protein